MLFLNSEYGEYETEQEVMDKYPSAAVVIEVEGGWMVFDTVDEYETWENQK